MLLRITVVCLTLILLSLPVAGSTPAPVADPGVALTAEAFKAGDFALAREHASQLSPGGPRDFLVGMASFKGGDWGGAVEALKKAAVSYPLLADYATYYGAKALFRLKNYGSAAQAVSDFGTRFPSSTLTRPALILLADARFEGGDPADAQTLYGRFVETYPAGSDSITALYRGALCRERLGDKEGAAAVFRTIWIRYPATDIAVKAGEELAQLTAAGTVVPPYSIDELRKRGETLFNLGRPIQASKEFQAVLALTGDRHIRERTTLRLARALFASRRYKDAEQTLRGLLAAPPQEVTYCEASFLLGKVLARTGRDEEAVATFVSLADNHTRSPLAAGALLDAAYVLKYDATWKDELPLLSRIIRDYPKSRVIPAALWEAGWASYLTGEYGKAADTLKRLVPVNAYRERALYWRGCALRAAGNDKDAVAAFTDLVTDYPLGFYAFAYRHASATPPPPPPRPLLAGEITDSFPLPEGAERARTLITFGLFDDARREIGALRKKWLGNPKNRPGLARLYLDMDDYHGAYLLFRPHIPLRMEADNLRVWGVTYPLPFRSCITGKAEATGLPEELVYSVIRAESSFAPRIVSPAGAIGLMQIMPSTACTLVKGKSPATISALLASPEFNVGCGIRHLRNLMTLYRGDVVLAIAAYNAGSGNVNRWLKKYGALRRDEFIEQIPFGETREYVKKVLGGAEVYRLLYALDKGEPATFPNLSGVRK